MIRNPRFDIYRIGDKEYLLPSGQNIQRRSKVMCLSGIAPLLWNEFEYDRSVVSMFRFVEEKYGAKNQDDRNIISVDVSNVCAAFIRAGALLEEAEPIGDRLLESEDIIVDRNGENGYICSFPRFDSVEDIYIDSIADNEDGAFKEAGVSTEHALNNMNAYYLNEIADYDYELRIATRIPYSYYALMSGRVFVHSASILYRGRLWLFAAPAGTGKTTHARMWEKNGSARIINGDLNLIGRKEACVGKGLAVPSIDRSGESSCECSCNRSVDRSDESSGEPWVYGTPWCGTSEIYELQDYPLGGIIILRQGYKDYIEDMSYEDGVIGILSRSVSPMWDKKLVRKNVDIISDIAKDIMICKLYCTINDSAYTLMKSYIDEYLDGK